MTWWSSGEVLAGIVVLVLWVVSLRMLGGRMRMSSFGFVMLPSIYLLAGIAGIVMLLNGFGFLR